MLSPAGADMPERADVAAQTTLDGVDASIVHGGPGGGPSGPANGSGGGGRNVSPGANPSGGH